MQEPETCLSCCHFRPKDDKNHGICVFNPPNQNVDSSETILKGVYPMYDSGTEACSNHADAGSRKMQILIEEDIIENKNTIPTADCTHINAKSMTPGKYGPWFSCPDCGRTIGQTFKDGNPNPGFDKIIEQKLNREE